MRSPVRLYGFGAVIASGWLTFFMAVPAASAQDMVGPSGDTPGSVPIMPPEAAEVLEDTEQASAPADESSRLDEESFRYQREWEALNDERRHQEAADLAITWYNDAVIQFGEHSAPAAAALRYQGDSYLSMNNAVLAAKAYNDSIKAAERSVGVFDSSLVSPLTSLGMVYLEQGDYDASVSALMRAKDITHRNQGIFNLEQSVIVDVLTETYANQGELRQATREQKFLLGTAAKTYGDANPELVPALQKWAKWNARIGRYPDARRNFYRAIDILEETYGPNDLRIVETLNMIARSFYDNTNTHHPREGSVALRRAVEIYRQQEFVDQADLLRQQSRLADWYMLAQRRTRGVRTYSEAIAEAKATGLDEETIDATFGLPRVLGLMRQPLGLTRVQLADLGDDGPHRVIFEFDLDKAGRARNVRVIEDTLDLISVVKTLRLRLVNSVFRPRFVDGQPMPTFGMRIKYDVFPQDNAAQASAPTYSSDRDMPVTER
ncbi:MAG: tetratricopeptide repeat protein [Gammaproteobacteria bacterium]